MPSITIQTFLEMKAASEKIAVLTAYDASMARVADSAGVDAILVGDSLGMVIQGMTTTLGVSVDDMVYHTSVVAAATERAFIISDMPFMSYATPAQAYETAARLMGEGDAQMVKLEGGRWLLETVSGLAERGVPVCAHLGLTPQSVHQLGGYRIQGREPDAAVRMREAALELEAAGAAMLVLECVPAALAAEISAALTIPTIGIGAGVDCDGQVLVLYDVIGVSPRVPKMAQDFLAGQGSVEAALAAYVAAVRDRRFPSEQHTFG